LGQADGLQADRGGAGRRGRAMTDHVIIDAAERFAKKALPPVDPLWTRTPEEKRTRFAPSVKTLPFVSAEWTRNEYWPDSMWADVPTNSYLADRERGKHFAKLTLAAMIADQALARPLQLIFESIVEDAIRRKAKGGRARGRCPPPYHGYLEGLAEFIAGKCLRSGPPAA
jgi:hypothetical protein